MASGQVPATPHHLSDPPRNLADMEETAPGTPPDPGTAPSAPDADGTLFVQFAGFADSVRDFYTCLGQVLARYDLDSGEYQGFKELLLDYVEAITEDVSFRAPRIPAALDTLWPRLPRLLEQLDTHAQGLPGLPAQSEGRTETRVQRSRGRELTDWEGLRGLVQGHRRAGQPGRPTARRHTAGPPVAAGQRQADAALGHRRDVAAPGPVAAGPVVRRGRAAEGEGRGRRRPPSVPERPDEERRLTQS